MKVFSNQNVADNDSTNKKYNPNLLKQQRNNNTRTDCSKISVDTNGWTWNSNDEEDLGLMLLFFDTVTEEKHLSTNNSTILSSVSNDIRLDLPAEEKDKKAIAVTREKNGEQGEKLEEMFSGDFGSFQCGEDHIPEMKESHTGGYRENHNELDHEFRRNIIRDFLEMVEQEERSLQT
ncbi:hypothetical protein INT45_000580 [Circinella minor]|uniref:Uncharacterized protein n=1 Tax=Circinella minor TaxID=1195481 RepID=A0A8H7SBS3_9FUNG|nr:hypothetical protein INT45_000580 [Circinella minor]